MKEPLVRVSRVNKRFRRKANHDSLRDWMASLLKFGGGKKTIVDEFWAVDDVSFQVSAGEAFGIIGPNGAGKSTLLKLLAGIMRPTRGELEVKGRISALIELGAGFHGDLTGRENIFLNASILGMTRREARRYFGDIVEFAGIEEFLDTPVKRYSSGMHARLGFAIAAHVSPQVLLVDEVLSVGDRVFRAKCMDKMNRFLKEGVAVVFVSHDLGSVARFCDRTVVLERGREIYCGSSASAVAKYFDACSESLLLKKPDGSSPIRVTNLRLLDECGCDIAHAAPGDRLTLEFDVSFDIDLEQPSYGLSIVRVEDHLAIFETSSTRLGHRVSPARRGESQRVRYDFMMNVLPGEYVIGYHVRDRDSLTYAAQDPYAARIMIGCPVESGGIVHVDPEVHVQEISGAHTKSAVLVAK